MGTIAPDMEAWSSGSFSPGPLYPSISWVLANATQANYFCILCLQVSLQVPYPIGHICDNSSKQIAKQIRKVTPSTDNEQYK